MKEEYLFTGLVEPTNEPYAIAKLAGIKTAESINRQYGLNYFSIIPTSLYGINDNYRIEESHVVAGLINRMNHAVETNQPQFEVWGTGEPLRELMHADDLANAILFLINQDNKNLTQYVINIGSAEEISIKDLVHLIAKEFNYKGEIVFNSNKPNGSMRKALDSSIMNELGWKSKISLIDGIKKTISEFKKNKPIRI